MSRNVLTVDLTEQYEKDAKKLWERFYKRNGVNFFKDRHYLHKEFPELLSEDNPSILEVGCGVGNACFPLLEAIPGCQIFAVDFSSRAVELLENHSGYEADRVTTAVVDISQPDLRSKVPFPSLDFCSMIFVLSAVSPDKMPIVVQNLKQLLKPGCGRVLFRDYAVGDLAQERFEQSGRKKKLAENFYLRGDGTRCYYFTIEFLQMLFEEHRYVCERISIQEREVENIKRKLRMRRRWIQAVFISQ